MLDSPNNDAPLKARLSEKLYGKTSLSGTQKGSKNWLVLNNEVPAFINNLSLIMRYRNIPAFNLYHRIP
jgi:hypothetical protein